MGNDQTKDIADKIEKFINVPLYLNEVSYNVIKNELVNIQNTKEREIYFAVNKDLTTGKFVGDFGEFDPRTRGVIIKIRNSQNR